MDEKKPVISPMTKKKLSEFDKAQSVGWVLDRAIQIEKGINNIIFNFIEPGNKEVFISHILNSSVMSYGGKLKVLHRIIGYDKESKKLYNDLQRIGSIRNSFAHTDFSYVMSMSFNSETGNRIWSNQVIDVMKSNGEIDSKNPSEFLEEYLNLLKKVEPQLDEIGRQQTSKMGNQ